MTDTRKKTGAERSNIKHAIDAILDDYFVNLNGQKPRNIYKLIIEHVEQRLLENTMQRAENQSKAAEMLGLGRNTLRTKLKRHNIPTRPTRRSRSSQKDAPPS